MFEEYCCSLYLHDIIQNKNNKESDKQRQLYNGIVADTKRIVALNKERLEGRTILPQAWLMLLDENMSRGDNKTQRERVKK